MYEKHFGLNHKPFAITPDPRYLYLGERHREALAHLLFGVGEGGGFVQLTGEVGTGKTTLCRSLLEQLPPEVDLALILNPRLDPIELVAAVCDELGVAYPAGSSSLKMLVGALNDHLLQAHAGGRRTVLVIDEAQNLSPAALEQVRLLTNLETAEIKLLEIILIGQPELRDLLARDDLRQLAQRITARYHLDPLGREEIMAYVRHRLQVAGVSRPLFTAAALKTLARISGGVPRLINIICDRALLGAYVEGRNEVDDRILRQAAKEVLAEPGRASLWFWRRPLLLPIILALLLVLAAFAHFYRWRPTLITAEPEVATETASQPSDLEMQITMLDHDPAAAWTALFALWGKNRDDDRPPCAQAVILGLRCLEGAGNWTLLRRYDRPALLRLTTPDGRSRIVLLKELAEQEGLLAINGEELRLPLSEIERYWYGDYQLLWQPPIMAELLREGDRGEDVRRLRAALDRLAPNAAIANDPTFFDQELTNRVIAFQQRHELQPDGIVGFQTILRLSETLNEPNAPSLGGNR